MRSGLKALGLKFKLDFILNHASVLSPQFQDLLKNGKKTLFTEIFLLTGMISGKGVAP